MPMDGLVEPRPEDREKFIRMGWWLNIPMGDILDRTAAAYPDKVALVDAAGRATYAELQRSVHRLAVGFLKHGIRPGDRVLLQLPNAAEFVHAFFALQKIGATAVLLLIRHMPLEINQFCRLTGATAWIVPDKHHRTDFLPVIAEVRESNPALDKIILAGQRGTTGFVCLSELREGTPTEEDLRRLASWRPGADEVSFILPTGGTTGLPKAVPRTHNGAVCEARYKAQAREQTAADVCLICVPLEHNLGLATLTSTVYSGGTVVMLDSTQPEDFCATVQREKVTRAPLVPALLSRLVGFDGLEKYDLSSLKALYVGGAKTPPELIQAVHRRIGRVYTSAFGMSEGPTCTTRPDDDDDTIINSIGRPCCPHDEFRVVDENGRALPRSAEGKLQAKGPGVFTGYLKNPEENRRAFTSDGFFQTGDVAVIDASGNIRITGRIKDIIIRGGENISPAEIEAMLRGHPDVLDVAVVGMPDEVLGERACAYLQPRPGASPTLESVVAFLKQQGASVLRLPERVELIDAIPLTNIGKPDKKALREDIRKRLAR